VLRDIGKSLCAQRDQEPIAYFNLITVIDGDRKPARGIVSARLDLSGTALPPDGRGSVGLRQRHWWRIDV
jgi:hypothetical protein